MRGLTAAVQLLTRIPVRQANPPEASRAVPWIPAVGLLVGAAVGAIAVGLGELVPAAVAAACAVAASLLITGALHEDGLADVADAFAGGWTHERRIEILDDPRHGTYGVAALAATIAIRVTAAASLPTPAVTFACFLTAHALGRAAAVAAMLTLPVASSAGMGATYARAVSRPAAVAGVSVSVAASAAIAGWWVAPLVAAAAAAAAATGWLARRKLGGISGDVLGAIEQVGECLVMVVVSGLAAHHAIWWSTSG